MLGQADPPRYIPFDFNRQEDHLEDYIRREFSPIEQIVQIPDNLIEEQVCTTFCKDFKNVMYKFWLTLIPRQNQQNVNYLRNWDLWGPFIISILYILIIGSDQKFLTIVYVIFAGAALVNFNIRSLGGSISYFQALSILGYCIFPIIMATFVLKILTLFTIKYMSVIMITMAATTMWSILSARAFISINVKPQRRFVALLPCALVYLYLSSHFIFYSYYSDAWSEGG